MGCGASTRNVKLKPETMLKIGALYNAIKGDDPDLEKGISRQDAKKFFKGKYGKLSADAMFNEVDTDHSDDITQKEFLEFWTQVRRNGYKEEDLVDEIDAMMANARDGKEICKLDSLATVDDQIAVIKAELKKENIEEGEFQTKVEVRDKEGKQVLTDTGVSVDLKDMKSIAESRFPLRVLTKPGTVTWLDWKDSRDVGGP